MRPRRISGARGTSVRGSARRTGPAVSLVLAIEEMRSSIESGLTGLAPECQRHGVEIVVACNGQRRPVDALRRRFPGVRFTNPDPTLTLADLRAVGMREATGEIVVLLDDRAPAVGVIRVAGLLAASVERASPYTGAGEPPMIPWRALLSRLWDATPPLGVPVQAAAAGRQPAATSHVVGD